MYLGNNCGNEISGLVFGVLELGTEQVRRFFPRTKDQKKENVIKLRGPIVQIPNISCLRDSLMTRVESRFTNLIMRIPIRDNFFTLIE